MRGQAEELSEFEKQRLANIAERDALLKKLTLEAQSSGLFAKPSPKTATGAKKDGGSSRSKKKAAPRIKKEDEPPLVRRMSSRLRGITADSEVEKRKADVAFEEAQQVEREKKMRKSDFFTLDNMLVSGQKLNSDALIGIDVVTKGVAKPYERTFGDEDVKKTTDKELKALREEMSNLQLWDQWEPNSMRLSYVLGIVYHVANFIFFTGLKMTPERVYTMTFHPSETKPLVFAGDKMGHLGVVDASQKRPEIGEDEDEEEAEEPDASITTLKPHTRTISSMVIHPQKPTHLYTASYDSSIREMDLEKTTSEEKYAPETRSMDEPISGIDMASDDHNCIYWTTLSGSFSRYDLRSPKTDSSIAEWQLSEKKIGGFSLLPSHPHFFATASLDRTMRLWDLRKLSHKNPEPVGYHESRLSVSHAAFNTQGQIATSSYDDSIKLYDFANKGIGSWEVGHKLDDKEMKPDTVVRHNCQTGRWVTM